MKKNVFQGFSGTELGNYSAVRGGIQYNATTCGTEQCDEEAITAKGEYNPYEDEVASYTSVDAKWECSGVSVNNPNQGGTSGNY